MAALLLCTGVGSSQQGPKRELRGVWLTTLSGLDWPPASQAGNADAQKASLLSILDNIRAMNLNAVFFQVRSRGNAFYAPGAEPWASELTGRLGANPGWDPLQFAVDACRARGLEVHAWINVFKVWSGGAVPARTTPQHVVHAHPEWVTRHGEDLWIDPGIPDARSYLVDVCADIARRYDVDALHLDYTRYPEADFNDGATYQKYGRGRDKAAWRRDNVTAFVRDLHERLGALKPRLQIGAAPIGIYENITGARGWQGLHAVSQDSRLWLREGYVDYLSPQIYWGLKSRGSTIDFEALVRDWQNAAAGRCIYAGTAPYKEDVRAALPEVIDAVRAQGAGGEVYFRYDHVRDRTVFRDRYALSAIPPAISWRDATRPNPPTRFAVSLDGGSATISWAAPVPAVDGDVAWQYAVYRGDAAAPGNRPVAVLPAGMTSFTDRGATGATYAVTALDRLHNESEAATTAIASGRQRLPAPSIAAELPRVSEPVDASDNLVLIAYEVPSAMMVRLRLLDLDDAETSILVDGMHEPGSYVIGIELDRLPGPVGSYVFEAGSLRVLRPF
jgi:uncharacterized lipoprotein YddW (UPF0748 family)